MVVKKQFDFKQGSYDRNGKEISFETGKLATQADSSITLKYGENVMLFTACMGNDPRPGTDFLPLQIDFRESFSAAGRIAGAVYRRREGRPPENAILYARMVDRALRPMFPKGMINDIVITPSPIALDHQYDLDVLTIIGGSLSVMAAGIPMDGPVGAVQIGHKDGKFLINPTKEELEGSLCNLLVAGKKGSINMIECGSNEIPKDLLKEAFLLAQQEIDKSCDIQSEFLKQLEIKPKEVIYNKPSEELIAYISNIITKDKLEAMTGQSKVPFNDLYNQYQSEVLELCAEKAEESEDFAEDKVKMGVFNVIKNFIRSRSLDTGKRLDDRSDLDIRPLYCEVGMTERNHGNGLFWRGDTQVMTTTTLGGPMDYLVYDDMENDNVRQRYFHHYNFPPFSVGEARWTRGQNRREIGHGKLAEKALMPMIPEKDVFPYSIRTVSECLGSGGSTSMGSVCGSTLSLLDAGVPLKKPVAGIAMGLITYHQEDGTIDKYMVLNDLQWVEDFTGDMDFKVAGTKDGVTAIQLDTKLKGITMDIVHETIDRAFDGYNEIMDFMLETIPTHREQLNKYAPKIVSIQVPVDKIKDVIGKGGEMIDKIIEQCDNIKIDFEDDGTCFLTHTSQEAIDKAIGIIKEITTDLEKGQIFDGEITRVENYGVFVQLPKGKIGLAHVSTLGVKFGDDITKSYKVWDTMKVKIIDIDKDGRIKVKKEV